MYTRILIPTDGSELSEIAIKHGVGLAKSVGAAVIGITVFAPYRPMATEALLVADIPQRYEEECQALGTKYLAVVTENARVAGIPCDVTHAFHEHPYQAIIETATARGCDLVCMASHGRRGVAAVLLGSETTKVLTHSRIPVLVCR